MWQAHCSLIKRQIVKNVFFVTVPYFRWEKTIRIPFCSELWDIRGTVLRVHLTQCSKHQQVERIFCFNADNNGNFDP
jgi:hypothetical protein